MWWAIGAALTLWGQTRNPTLTGYVKDRETGEALIGATVAAYEQKLGVQTNEYGYYSLRLPPGKYRIAVASVGYAPDTFELTLDKDVTRNIELAPEGRLLETVVVEAGGREAHVASVEMSNVKMDVAKLKRMPALFGETDVIRTLQLTPGVKSAGEGNGSFFVRGGNYDQNLILLDDATVYNPNHFLGFFSVFNADAVKDATLYKGGIPAAFGGRLSSVLNIRMKEGNVKKYTLKGGIGLLSSRVSFEGPIVRQKGSFLVTGRRSYADLFVKLAPDPSVRNNELWFYDVNGKINYAFGEKDRLYASIYHGRDKFGFGEEFQIDWGNVSSSVRWNRLFSQRLFCNTTATFSDFDYTFYLGQQGARSGYSSAVRDGTLKFDLDYYMNPQNHLRFGATTTFQRFIVGDVKAEEERSSAATTRFPRKYALQYAVYLSNEQNFGPRWTVHYGIRYAIYHQLGRGYLFGFEGKPDLTVEDTLQTWGNGQIMKTYHGPEPRVAVNFRTDVDGALKFSYNRTRQFMQVAGNANAGLPIDIWLPSMVNVPPQHANQLAVGYFRNFNPKNFPFEASVEVYYKHLANQIELNNDALVFGNPYVEYQFVFGRGRAYGVEWLLQKTTGKLNGWVGYTLSWSERSFPGTNINGGRKFFARNDRRHDFSFVVNWEINARWSVGATWIYGTGLPITLPSGKYRMDGYVVGVYTGRNEYRMPDQHRLDVSATLFGRSEKRWRSSWNFSVYNVYFRKNPWAIFLRTSPDGQSQNAVKIYLFGIVPSITYNFEF
ncbi:MAG: TonB-dependent receptor [Bacteroidia bacterium]|nr:TonB-dependent receptor [Bacteroidia bacterium]MDW8333849.1 TonB-dependent receptor [Bacteroidia bacterium]